MVDIVLAAFPGRVCDNFAGGAFGADEQDPPASGHDVARLVQRRMSAYRRAWSKKRQDLSDHFYVELEIQF